MGTENTYINTTTTKMDKTPHQDTGLIGNDENKDSYYLKETTELQSYTDRKRMRYIPMQMENEKES